MQESAFETTATTKHKSIFSRNFNANVLRDSLLKDEYLDIDKDETPGCYYKSLSEVTLDFFMNIALNHNVLVDVEGSENNRTSYSGSNPDETVLVQAAKELEVEFVERIGNDITIRIGGKCLVHYEMLYRFDFTSERKRSSIIVRCPDGVIKLFMKGADSVILQKINHFSKMNLFTKTCEHIDKFAKEGLRTLCYSMKILTENEFKEFVSTEGYKILVGKNNRQNDYLTTVLANKGDLWFHTKNIPGSHVIVFCDGNEVSDETILKAATLAAQNSKAADSAQVPVDYTPVKFVKKPNGAKPGMVIYTTNKTVYINPKGDTLA
jgi:hypothetical protein